VIITQNVKLARIVASIVDFYLINLWFWMA